MYVEKRGGRKGGKVMREKGGKEERKKGREEERKKEGGGGK